MTSKYKLLFIIVFALSTFFTTVGVKAATYHYLGVDVGQRGITNSTESWKNDLSNASNTLSDTVRALDAYTVYWSYTHWKPTVTRGEPVYRSYWIHDNKINETYVLDDYNGEYLTDWESNGLAFFTEISTNYFPGEDPLAVLEMKAADGVGCASKPYACSDQQNISQIYIK